MCDRAEERHTGGAPEAWPLGPECPGSTSELHLLAGRYAAPAVGAVERALQVLRPVHVRQARVQLGRLVEQPREELAHAAPRARPARLAPPAARVRSGLAPGRGPGGHVQALLGRPGQDSGLQLRRGAQADGVRQGQPGRGAVAAACAGGKRQRAVAAVQRAALSGL